MLKLRFVTKKITRNTLNAEHKSFVISLFGVEKRENSKQYLFINFSSSDEYVKIELSS